jgi:hypothetical protein
VRENVENMEWTRLHRDLLAYFFPFLRLKKYLKIQPSGKYPPPVENSVGKVENLFNIPRLL